MDSFSNRSIAASDGSERKVSEAMSLIESCVPHGKPMLAQAQKRLENLEAIRTLERVTTDHFQIHGIQRRESHRKLSHDQAMRWKIRLGRQIAVAGSSSLKSESTSAFHYQCRLTSNLLHESLLNTVHRAG